jgi:hypothetical protein
MLGDVNDHNQFILMYELANKNVEGLPNDCQVLEDNGYSNDKNTKYCEENEINGFIQNRKNAMITNNKTIY